MKTLNKIAQVCSECVACGCCIHVCPKGALRIYEGMWAVVEESKCIGCGKCVRTCPAGAITVAEGRDSR